MADTEHADTKQAYASIGLFYYICIIKVIQNYLSYLTLGGGGRMEKLMTVKKYTKKNDTTAYMFNVYTGRNPKTSNNVYRRHQGFKTKKKTGAY